MRFRAEGKSMYPTIRDGEVINVEPVKPRDVKRGDALLCRGAKGVIAHLVVAITRTEQRGLSNEQEKKNARATTRSSVRVTQSSALGPHCFFILRGDSSDFCDEPVEAERLMGKVVAVERDGRSVALDSRWAKILRAVRARAARLRRAISYQRSGIGRDSATRSGERARPSVTMRGIPAPGLGRRGRFSARWSL